MLKEKIMTEKERAQIARIESVLYDLDEDSKAQWIARGEGMVDYKRFLEAQKEAENNAKSKAPGRSMART